MFRERVSSELVLSDAPEPVAPDMIITREKEVLGYTAILGEWTRGVHTHYEKQKTLRFLFPEDYPQPQSPFVDNMLPTGDPGIEKRVD